MRRVLTETGALRAWWSLAMVLMSAVLVAGACIVYTNIVQRDAEARQERARQEADRRWCALMASLDQPEAPATTDRGQRIQQQIHQLRRDLGCEDR